MANEQRSEDEREVMELDRKWTEAYRLKDQKTLEHLLADDFHFTELDGRFYDKHQYIQSTANKRDWWTHETYEYDMQDVMTRRVASDTIILTGAYQSKARIDGSNQAGRFRFTDVFVKRNNRWQAVGSQCVIDSVQAQR